MKIVEPSKDDEDDSTDDDEDDSDMEEVQLFLYVHGV